METIGSALLKYILRHIKDETAANEILSQYIAENRDYIEWVLDRPLKEKFAYFQISCLRLNRMMLEHLTGVA